MSMLGRRGLLKSFGLLPVAGKHKREPDVGWTNQQFQLLIVNAQAGGFSGAFVYSPGPGAGNLISSITSQSGTDPYGNLYLQGVTSYGEVAGVFYATQSNEGGLTFYHATSESSGWTSDGSLVSGKQEALPGAILANSPLLVESTITAVTGSPLAVETWHTAILTASFTAAGVPPPAYEYEPVNGGRVRLRGNVQLLAAVTAGTIVFTLPGPPGVSYQPSFQQNFVTANTMSGYSAGNPVVTANTDGTITIDVSGVNGNTFRLDGIVIELD